MKKIKNDILIETKNLVQSYPLKNGSVVNALDGVNLEIYKGEFLTVMGRSGSGKTTLLNLIGALNRPTNGEVMFEGKNLCNFSNQELALLRREKIGFIFQTFNLLPTLTVFENVESALIHTSMSRNEIAEKILNLLNFFGVADKSNMLPHELSVGQQQKVAIARALIKDPLIIIADEPTGNMDPIAGKEIVSKLVELNHKSKITIVVASHGNFPHPEIDRKLFLKAGKIVSRY